MSQEQCRWLDIQLPLTTNVEWESATATISDGRCPMTDIESRPLRFLLLGYVDAWIVLAKAGMQTHLEPGLVRRMVFTYVLGKPFPTLPRYGQVSPMEYQLTFFDGAIFAGSSKQTRKLRSLAL